MTKKEKITNLGKEKLESSVKVACNFQIYKGLKKTALT